MKKIKWTSQQRRAIKHRGADVLVTASAGTGKTAVLSGRCVDIVADKNVCPDVWSVLVLTFTDAAAEQMRDRIAQQLRRAYTETKNAHLREQLVLLQGADISTIHSFCKRLITEYFYKLGVDPTFGIIDADEQRLLKSEVLAQTINWAWEQSNLTQGLKELLDGRNIGGSGDFLTTVIDISDFLETVVWRDNWYEQVTQNAQAGEFSGTKQKELVTKRLNEAISAIQGCSGAYQKLANGTGWSEKIRQSHLEPLEKLSKLLEQDKWDEFAAALLEFKKPRTYAPKDLDKPAAELLANTVRDALSVVEQLSEYAILNPDYMEKIGVSAGRQVLVLIELVRKFEKLYSQAKQKLNRMDFADLERYALRLLADETNSEGQLIRTEAAKALCNRYKYIFVDEYQDINPVQKAILDLLSNKGGVFVVGDVKQSIYAFRGAQPRIFAKDLEGIKDEISEAAESVRVDLNNNFRSAKGILDFINTVFSRIMRRELAEIDYDEAARLKPGEEQQAAEVKGPRVELHILDEKLEEEPVQQQDEAASEQQEDSDITTARQRQAAMIAQRIRQMVGADTGKAEFEVSDVDAQCRRPVEYRDIVLLMRSVAKRVNDYVEVFQLAGIPVSCEAAAGYFEATEIRDCLCLLKVLDNPQRDIELAAVLRGPIFSISDTELAKIRLFGQVSEKCNSFYDCVVKYSQAGPQKELADKLKDVLATIERWRETARREKLSDLIWQIYGEKKLPAFYSALANGKNRRANLLKLHERAIQFEGFASSSGVVSLGRFISFIERLQESGAEWSTAEPEDAAANAVRIMSVHKSKGLEFPVVFLAELNSPFNMVDVRQPVLINSEDGLGIEIIERQANARLSSAAHQIIAENKRMENLAEEMRILYVAMTRARERLILSACKKKKNCAEVLAKASLLDAEEMTGQQLANCKRAMDWILFGLSGQADLHKAFETALEVEAESDDLLELKLYGTDELRVLSDYIQQLRTKKAPISVAGKAEKKKGDSALLKTIKQLLSWQYEHTEATALPSKQSVTSLTHRDDEFVVMDYSRALERLPVALMSGDSRLAAATEGRIVGTATHTVIEKLDLRRPVNKEAVETVIENLIGQGVISNEAARCIDADSITAFFESEPGKLAIDETNIVEREWPFTYAMEAGEGEKIVVQGIIDMLVKTNDGLWIIDFKTDHVNTEQIQQRAENYRGQLELYGKAAETILKSKVLGRWLYFLSPRRAISV